jgi:hypothetical protein
VTIPWAAWWLPREPASSVGRGGRNLLHAHARILRAIGSARAS